MHDVLFHVFTHAERLTFMPSQLILIYWCIQDTISEFLFTIHILKLEPVNIFRKICSPATVPISQTLPTIYHRPPYSLRQVNEMYVLRVDNKSNKILLRTDDKCTEADCSMS